MAVITRSSRVVGTSLCALVAVGSLSSCLSTPSNRRVVQDQIEALDLDADQEQCMLNKVRDDYTDDELEQIGDENESADFDDPAWVDNASDEMRTFVGHLEACIQGTADDDSTESTEATESTGETETTESTEAAAETTG